MLVRKLTAVQAFPVAVAGCVRTCKVVTQYYLRYAETIRDRYRYLKSTLPTVGERGVGEIECNLRAQAFVGDESLLSAR